MIPGIEEKQLINGTLQDGWPSYATLNEATATLVDMGERTISSQVRIDGSVAPDVSGWELEFMGERFILPTKEPQAAKDNSSLCSRIDLVFRSWVVEELKRYYYFQPAAINASTAIADQYQASVRMSLSNFVANFNSVLRHYWPDGEIVMLLDTAAATDTNLYLVEIDHLKVWEVLTRFYEIFHRRWTISVVQGVYQIKVGYDPQTIPAEEHTFEYGHSGGLAGFERQVQGEDITNVLLGRGGEKNLPYRYFKKVDPNNPSWKADPDAIPELKDINFDRLHDANFRWYVRGWMHNPNRDTSGDEAWDSGHTFPTYTDSGSSSNPYYIGSDSPYYWAFYKGRYVDDHFDPVEYVKNDESITKYGEHWGALDDNDDIYPTIQGRNGVDESIAFSEITTDDIQEAAAAAAIENSLQPMLASYHFFQSQADLNSSDWENGNHLLTGTKVYSQPFTIRTGKVGLVSSKWVTLPGYKTPSPGIPAPEWMVTRVHIDTTTSTLKVQRTDGTYVDLEQGEQDGGPTIALIPAGSYRLELTLNLYFDDTDLTSDQRSYIIHNGVTGSFGLDGIVVTSVDAAQDGNWAPTFDMWVKNIWGTTLGFDEAGNAIPKETVGAVITEGGVTYTVTQALAEQNYAERVWLPILGDRQSNEARVVFSTGLLSISSDYEFPIASIPVYDTSRPPFHWRITMHKSDAEYQSTGKYIPSVQIQPSAGDKFFFVGIDMPIQYTIWAEEELNTYKQAELSGLSIVNPTWVVTPDKLRIQEEEAVAEGETPQPLLIERLHPGVRVYVKDPRFAPTAFPLFVQSITYKWQNSSEGGAYMLPDVELVLSNEGVPQVGTVAKLQGQVKSIQSEYVRADQVEDTVRRISSVLYLKKTGESDSSQSPTSFSSKVTSNNFRQGGAGGSGWGIYKSNGDSAGSEAETDGGDSVIECDRVVVRKELQVNSLVVNQVEARGGKEILSAAKIQVSKVIYDATSGYYNVYFDQKQGSVANLFVVGDIALCQRFNEAWDTASPTKYYRMVVRACGGDYISLDSHTNDGDMGSPEEGDVIVQYGHISNAARQYVIVRDVIDGGYERMLSGLTGSFDEEAGEWAYTGGTEYYFAGRQSGSGPRWFVGDPSGEYAEWDDGSLNIKGGLIVRKYDGSYQAMTDYMSGIATALTQMQAQIDGQIQSWAGDDDPLPIEDEGQVDPSTANYPASSWTTVTDRLKHMGDIYVNNTTGQGWRYTRQANDGDFYWMRITDAELATALAAIQVLQGQVAGLEYLKNALGSSTLIQGGLVLTSLIQLGQTENNVFRVYSGINGTFDQTLSDPSASIAAWFGGPMVDHEASPSEVSYARSLFRFNGSGYLAGGKVYWNADGYGGIPGITWSRQNNTDVVTINGNVKLESLSGDTVTDLINAVRSLSSMFALEGAGTVGSPYRIKALYSLFTEGSITAGTPGSSSGGGGGSAVEWTPILLSGTRIATITIDDDAPIDVYAPAQITESDVSGWGFTKNAGTITGITMNGASKGTSGVVDLGNVITAHQSVTSENATIGTALTKIATIGGTEIKAKITHQSLANYVTLNSAQTITAIKTFNEKIIANNGIRLTTGTPLKFLVSDTEYSPLVFNAWINSNKLYFAITPDVRVTGDATLGTSGDFWKGVYAEDMYAKGFISWKVKGTTQGANDEGVFRFYTRKLVDGSEVWKNSLTVEYDEGLTADGDIKPLNGGTNNLGSSAAFWNKGYIKELRMAEYGTSIFAGGTGEDAILSIWGSAQDHYGDIVIGHYNASARRSLRLTTKDSMYFSVKNADKMVMGANDFRPATNNGLALGTSSFRWSTIHASKWYPGTDQQAWVELVDGRLTVHGDLVATGNIVAGTPGQNTAGDYVEFTTALNTYSSDDAIATDDSTALTSAITAIQSGSVRRLVDANGWYSIMSVESDSSTYGRIYFMMRGAVMCLYYSNSQSKWYITDDMSD